MPTPVSCGHCAATFAAAVETRGPWVECPRCRGRIANPAGPRGFSLRPTLAGMLGAFLFGGGCLMANCGGLFYLWMEVKPQQPAIVLGAPALGWALAGACVTTLVTGAILLLGSIGTSRGTPRTSAVMAVAAVLGLAAAAFLAATYFGTLR